MPLIEEVPQAKKAGATPGWAYVPDTGFDPSKAPIVPTGRKRTARGAPSTAAGEVSARQQSKIQQHLAALDRENNKDVQIEIPNRPRDPAQRGMKGKVTPGVKKILQSHKTFANHLDDEEAMIALEQEQGNAGRGAKAPGPKGKRASFGRQETLPDTMDVDGPTRAPVPSDLGISQQEMDELTDSKVPLPPTSQELDALLQAPPLSYNAARAAPSSASAPARQFCEICGYWGRVRCMKCGTRICGLECKIQHDETKCQKFWA